MKVRVVPLLVGALGTPAKALDKRLNTIGIDTNITELQKTVLININRILRNVAEVWGVLLRPYLKKKPYPLVELNVRLFNNNNNNKNNNNKNKNNNSKKEQETN